MMENQLEKLLSLNVNEFTEKKNNLTYLSWSIAWREFLKVYPKAIYDIKKDENGLCVFGNEKLGYMVYTTVTADGITREMWLLVMDGANKAMKDEAYTYEVAKWEWNNATRKKEKTGVETKTCAAIDMFDINKTVMRCLTKNLAMFGLGLYIYSGEDLPEELDKSDTQADMPKEERIDPNKKIGAFHIEFIRNSLKKIGKEEDVYLTYIGHDKLTDMTVDGFTNHYKPELEKWLKVKK